MRFLVLGLLSAALLNACGQNNNPSSLSTESKLTLQNSVLDFNRAGADFQMLSQPTPLSTASQNSVEIPSTITMVNTDFQTARRIERSVVQNPNSTVGDQDVPAIAQKAATELFPNFDLQSTGVQKGTFNSYASFMQMYKGREVIGARVVLRITQDGQLKTASSTLISPDLLSSIAPAKKVDVRSSDFIQEGHTVLAQKAVVYPRKELDGTFKVYNAQEVDLVTTNVLNEIHLFIDEDNQQSLGVWNAREHLEDQESASTTSIVIQGSILPDSPLDQPTLMAMPGLSGIFDKSKVSADENGNLDLSKVLGIKGKITLENKFLSVVNNQKSDSAFYLDPKEITGTEVNIDAGPALEERNVYFWVMTARKWLQDNLNYNRLNYQMLAIANYQPHYDNAFFMPTTKSLQFGMGDIYFKNLALARDVIIHEFGHAVTQEIYGTVPGFEFSAMNEAFSDYFAATVTGDPQMGNGTMLPRFGRSYLRTVDNNMVYPKDYTGVKFHDDGQMFSGALWDIRKALGQKLGDQMVHEARLAQARSISEFYAELLAIDDTNLKDWRPTSPNSRTITKAFMRHGLNPEVKFLPKSQNLMLTKVQGCFDF